MTDIRGGEKVRKAVFPVAGGSRFLPANKANPKEMMAAEAGILAEN